MSIKRFEGFTIEELTHQPELATSLLIIAPNTTIPPHRHDLKEKAYYVVEGCCTLHCYPGWEVCLRAGKAVSITPGTIHSIACEDEGVRILVSFTPPFDDVTWLDEKPQPIADEEAMYAARLNEILAKIQPLG